MYAVLTVLLVLRDPGFLASALFFWLAPWGIGSRKPAMAQLTKEFPRLFKDAHALGRRKHKVVLEARLH